MTMRFKVSARMEGLKKALSDPALIGQPMNRFLFRSGLAVERRAKIKAAVDTGRMRNAIRTVVEGFRAIVGVFVHYAPHVEFGTRPHWPPIQAVERWARRHGFPARGGAFMVARAIARRGTRAQPFMRPAIRESQGDIYRFLRDAARDIERRWQRRG